MKYYLLLENDDLKGLVNDQCTAEHWVKRSRKIILDSSFCYLEIEINDPLAELFDPSIQKKLKLLGIKK